MALVIEQSEVAPPPGTAAKLTLPLTYLDFLWLGFIRMRRILFYNLPISKTSFVQTFIPQLKDSLSLTLKHYIHLAGNVVCPLNSSGYPELRYVAGDCVSVIFSETDMDFNFLVGNHPRNAEDFYPLVPRLADATNSAPGVQLAPVLAIQVTLFPDLGISIGFTNHHVAGDGATMVRFIRAWALLNKFGEDEQFLADEFVPFYDRSVIKDPHGLGMSQWDLIKKKYNPEMCDIVTPPGNKVRSTFVIGRDDIVKLKNLALSRRPSLTHVTSFSVTSAYVWTCLIKSKAAIGEEMDENAMEFFACVADCRAQFSEPVPPTYVGNCIVPYITRTRHDELFGKEGFTIAVELIGEVIQKRRKDEEWIRKGDWINELIATDKSRRFAIAGSPKHDLYAADFSWGRPEKFEFISIDGDRGITMSLSKSRDCDGDLEIGLCLPKNKMNAFASLFTQGLSFLY